MSDPAGLPARTRMPARFAALCLGLAVLWPAMVAGPVTADKSRKGPSRASQLTFMWAMAGQESGWDYFARNRSSGAFGKYQIMPFNWPSWAAKYLGDAHADPTPANQERVAYGKLRDLHHWLGSWRRVAHWWLTGSSEPNRRRWSAYARGYVDNIMALRRRAPAGGGLSRGPASGSWLERGDWRRAQEPLGLRVVPGGRIPRRGGRLSDGQVVRIRATREGRDGFLWLRVVTIDGRIGWVKAIRTVPTREPERPGRWKSGQGGGREDRSRARPRAR